jgi:spore germination protein YaaH
VTDAELLATLVDEVRRSGVHTISLWRLGLEDPAVWETVVR